MSVSPTRGVEYSLLWRLLIMMGATDIDNRDGILAIDDELELLDVVRKSLDLAGFKVHTASTAQDGIELYEKNWKNIKVVLLDYVMPEMTEDLIFECLKRQNPDVRAILLTGCEDHVANPMFQEGLFGYMHKPFFVEDLIHQVQQAIDSV
ncbi:MAG: response regulator [Verrucomicrobiia bacterium]|jgi:DNA-binding NtrC family response regulator